MDFKLIENYHDLEGLNFRYKVAIDTETTGLGSKARLVAVQVYDGVTTAVLDVRKMPPDSLLQRVRGKDWVFQNGKFDLQFLMPALDRITNGEPWTAWGGIWDTMLAEMIIAAGLDKPANLPALAYKYCRIRMSKSEQTAFVRNKDEDDGIYAERLRQPFTQSQLDYMVEDVHLLLTIERAQRTVLEQNHLMTIARLEMDLMPVLADMERIGAKVNVPAIQALITEFSQELGIAEHKLIDDLTPHVLEWRADKHALSEARVAEFDAKAAEQKSYIELAHTNDYGTPKERRAAINADMKRWRECYTRPARLHYDEGPINPGSTQQVLAALQHLGLSLTNTQSETLDIIRGSHDDETVVAVLGQLLDYRQLDKLIGSTLEPIMELHGDNGRVHPNFHQMVRTGRMACSAPNLQNIPVRSERGVRIRQAFIPETGSALLSADYSQIELRVLAEDIANKTGDRTMLEMFLRGEDVHQSTAAQMYGVALDQVEASQRRDAKTINFGLAYGMTDTGLARDLRCSKAEAKKKRARHFEVHTGIQGWMDYVKKEAKSLGYAHTMLGRRRYFPPAAGEMTYWEEKAYQEGLNRQAMNTPIQGTAADIMKRALVENWKQVRAIAWQFSVVHDEIVEEAPLDIAQDVAEITHNAMVMAGESVLKLCPVTVDVTVGETWS